MKVAYLINVYPKVSHAFVRREILALEGRGVEVRRFSVRRAEEKLVDPKDLAEAERTAVLLDRPARLAWAALAAALTRPASFARAARLAVRLGRAGGAGVVKHAIYLCEAALLARLCEAGGVRHLHAHFGTNPAAVGLLAKMLSAGRLTFSFTVHGPDEFDSPSQLGLRTKISGADAVMAISEFTRSQLMRWSDPADWARISVVRCGVDATFLDGAGERRWPAGKFACVGRLSEQKGHHVLLGALSALKARGAAAHVTLVGDGPMRAALTARAGQLGVQDMVTFVGNRTSAEIREHLLSSAAMVLPSFAEGLPVVIMEALALRTPVVSTYVAGIPELVRPGANGWLVPSGSAEALADAMQACMAMPEERLAEMGTTGATDVRARHAATIEAGKLKEIFSGLGPGGNAR